MFWSSKGSDTLDNIFLVVHLGVPKELLSHSCFNHIETSCFSAYIGIDFWPNTACQFVAWCCEIWLAFTPSQWTPRDASLLELQPISAHLKVQYTPRLSKLARANVGVQIFYTVERVMTWNQEASLCTWLIRWSKPILTNILIAHILFCYISFWGTAVWIHLITYRCSELETRSQLFPSGGTFTLKRPKESLSRNSNCQTAGAKALYCTCHRDLR